VQRPTLVTLAVATLLVLAGCSAAPADDTASTVTPVPVPTDAPGERRLAPGLSGDGILDAEALAAAHRRHLDGVSYTERTDVVVLSRDGAPLAGRHLSVEHGEDAYLLEFSLTGERRRESRSYQTVAATVWSNRTVTVQSVTNRANTTDRERLDSEFYREFVEPNVRLHAQVLARNGARIVERSSRGERTRYHLRATVEDVPPSFGIRGAAQARDATLRAVVTDRGVIARVVVVMPVVYGGRTATLRHEFTYTRVGDTSAARPPWFEAALADGRSVPAPSAAPGNATATGD
jgi:hypothetical protein